MLTGRIANKLNFNAFNTIQSLSAHAVKLNVKENVLVYHAFNKVVNCDRHIASLIDAFVRLQRGIFVCTYL